MPEEFQFPNPRCDLSTDEINAIYANLMMARSNPLVQKAVDVIFTLKCQIEEHRKKELENGTV